APSDGPHRAGAVHGGASLPHTATRRRGRPSPPEVAPPPPWKSPFRMMSALVRAPRLRCADGASSGWTAGTPGTPAAEGRARARPCRGRGRQGRATNFAPRTPPAAPTWWRCPRRTGQDGDDGRDPVLDRRSKEAGDERDQPSLGQRPEPPHPRPD